MQKKSLAIEGVYGADGTSVCSLPGHESDSC